MRDVGRTDTAGEREFKLANEQRTGSHIAPHLEFTAGLLMNQQAVRCD
jgi:hypothetical protein